jgi:molybdenum cofactor cytidylyltransferase
VSPRDRLWLVVVAAGPARRLGRDKATLPWGQTTLVRHVYSQFPAWRVARWVVVANRRNHAAVRRALPDDVEIVVNPDKGTEMIASVRLGIDALGEIDGPLCIHPVDVFAVSRELVTFLHEAWRADREHIHLPEVRGKGGHPLILPPRFVPAIGAIPPGHGLAHVVHEHGAEVVRHAWHDERLLADLDTPEDYARYQPPVGLTHARGILRRGDRGRP